METSLSYHRKTSYDRNTLTGRALDWDKKPDVFKTYTNAVSTALADPLPVHSLRLWDIHSRPKKNRTSMNLETLSTLLHLTCALTAKSRHPDGDFFYRSAASAGALFPIEIYVHAHRMTGLASGLYHFDLKNRRLSIIRHGTEDPGAPIRPAVSLYLTGIFFRSSWKYGKRAYRYVLLDGGHVLHNLCLALSALGLPHARVPDFHDDDLNAMLGLDSRREACIGCIHVCPEAETPSFLESGQPFSSLPEPPVHPSPLPPAAAPPPLINHMHDAGKCVAKPAGEHPVSPTDVWGRPSDWIDAPAPLSTPDEIPYPRALLLRRSKRNFIFRPMDSQSLFTLLKWVNANLESGLGSFGANTPPVVTAVLVNAVDGVQPGGYLYDRKRHRLGLVAPGNSASAMASVCLEQQWLKNAAVHFLFLANLAGIDAVWGPRGYRHAMMTAGELGQSLYVGATALNLGSCGIGAIFDAEAQRLLGLNPDAYLLYLLAVGPVKS